LSSTRACSCINIGAVSFPASGEDMPAVLRAADAALYAAKRAGRNRVSLGERAAAVASTA
jgi:GGDEF domain-containing protein